MVELSNSRSWLGLSVREEGKSAGNSLLSSSGKLLLKKILADSLQHSLHRHNSQLSTQELVGGKESMP